MPEKDEQTEEYAGRFFLNLYHRQVISEANNWLIKADQLQQELTIFMNQNANADIRNYLEGTENSLAVAQRSLFSKFTTNLTNSVYIINKNGLIAYRNKLMQSYSEQFDKIKRAPNKNSMEARKLNGKHYCKKEASDFLPQQKLDYYGGRLYNNNVVICNSESEQRYCYVCCTIFRTFTDLREHLRLHRVESNYVLAKDYLKLDPPYLTVHCKRCECIKYFDLHITTESTKLTIEKIIIITKDLKCHYIKAVPLHMNKETKLVTIDFAKFELGTESPLIFIIKDKNKNKHVLESHLIKELSRYGFIKFNNLYNGKFCLRNDVDEYIPSAEICEALKPNFKLNKLLEASKDFNSYVKEGNVLTETNIIGTMNVLLQMEDIATMYDYYGLIRRNEPLTVLNSKNKHVYKLMHPRHSFILDIIDRNDKVWILPSNNATTKIKAKQVIGLLNNEEKTVVINQQMVKIYEASVLSVQEDFLIILCMHDLSEKRFVILFRPMRIILRFQYRALNIIKNWKPKNYQRILFPRNINRGSLKNISNLSLQLQNENIVENPEQLEAVKNIAHGLPKDAPYIIYGMPGTGKTTIIVESIYQLYLQETTKILVTSSSNSACDEIALRLCRIFASKGIRNAVARIYCRKYEKTRRFVDNDLLECSNLYAGHIYPDIGTLHDYRITICTFGVVGILSMGGFGVNGIYTHIFVDEAAASTEPEVLIALANTISSKTRLILAGDHKLLGAVVRSQNAVKYGLKQSLMERLLQCACYETNENGVYDKAIQIQLNRNYRSHEKIINLFSGLFYENKVIPSKNNVSASAYTKWHKIPQHGQLYPIVFHSTSGPCKFGKHSRSQFNLSELKIVLDYVKEFLLFGIDGKLINESDIGIISPYKCQYEEIEQALRGTKIEIGTAELFQGKEKSIIIASFVRSKDVGFLREAQRINSIITRAKNLLILIGNDRELLKGSKILKHIIDDCKQNGTFLCSNSNANELTKAMQTVTIKKKNKVKTKNKTIKKQKKKSESKQKTIA